MGQALGRTSADRPVGPISLRARRRPITGRPERVGAFRGRSARDESTDPPLPSTHRRSACLAAGGLRGSIVAPTRAGTHEPCRRDPCIRLRTDRRSRPSRPFRPPTQSIGDGPHEHSARHRHHSPDLHRAPARSGQRPGHRARRRGLRPGRARCVTARSTAGRRSSSRSPTSTMSQAVVSLARETGPRAGGPQRRAQRRRPQRHARAGSSSTSRDMKALDIDVEGRTAWCETGLTAAEVTERRRARTGWPSASVTPVRSGSAGSRLGGGVGYLVRKFGLTIDDVLAAEVVTADGRAALEVDADHHPDLFWAIRGGGGNFGVVDALQVPAPRAARDRRRHADPARDAETCRRLHRRVPRRRPTSCRRSPTSCPARRCRSSPRSTTASSSIFGLITYAGDPADGRAGGRAAPRAGDAAGRHVHRAAVRGDVPAGGCRLPPDGGVADDVHRPGRSTTSQHGSWSGWQKSDASMRVAQLAGARRRDGPRPRRCDGVRPSVEPDHGQRRRLLRGPEDDRRCASVGRRVRRRPRTGRHAAPTSTSCSTRARSASAPPIRATTWDRLAAIKARYDPTNLFRLNQNIPPVDRGRRPGPAARAAQAS